MDRPPLLAQAPRPGDTHARQPAFWPGRDDLTGTIKTH